MDRAPLRLTTCALLTAVLLTAASSIDAEDCNANGVDDAIDIATATSRDCNANAIPDECDFVDGGIQFEIAQRIDLGNNAADLVIADFDGDGDIDMALPVRLDPAPPDANAGIRIVENLGGLRFEAAEFIATGAELVRRPLSIYGADLDGDGDTDLVARLRISSEIAWTLNNGDGTFAEPSFLQLGAGAIHHLATGDIDGDGDVDLVAVGYSRSTIAVVRNDGDGEFESAVTIRDRASFVRLDDLDGDGDSDMAVVSLGPDGAPNRSLRVYRSNGDFSFAEQSFPLPGSTDDHFQSGQLATGDVDADGTPDIVVASSQDRIISVFIGNGDATFQPGLNHATGLYPDIVELADLDLDGDLDVATTGKSRVHAGPEDLTILLNSGDGTLAGADIYRIGDHHQPTAIAIGDLSGDRLPDVVVENYWQGNVTVYRNVGNGQLESEGTQQLAHGGSTALALDDLDGDGDLDVAGASIIFKNGLSILENVSGQEFNRGCGEFIRGDVNMDGQVSATDIVMLRRYLFEPVYAITCEDSADVTDNDLVTICDAAMLVDRLFRSPDWSATLPMPSPEPGIDPTGFSGVEADLYGNCRGSFGPEFPLGCADSAIIPPGDTDAVVTIGSVDAEPGSSVLVPVLLTTDVAIDAVQLVFRYDQELIEIDPEGLVLENTYYDRFELGHPGAFLTVHPAAGVTTLVAGSLFPPARLVQPGSDHVLAWFTVNVLETAGSGIATELEPSNGRNGDGVGPFSLRNEIVVEGGARFLSVRNETEAGFVNIVGDQAFFSRGDANVDGRVDVSDAIHTLTALFLGGLTLDCEDAADANDDGAVNVSDASTTLDYLFVQTGGSLPMPHPEPGPDPTRDDLGCSPAATE